MKVRVLFITKRRGAYGYQSSGLRNSVNFICEMLNDSGISAHSVDVIDNNDIDREVTKYRPKCVIIEALWVVPGKFDVLKKLHPKVKWVMRIHSDIPFLANEGTAIKWLFEYARHGITITSNSTETAKVVSAMVGKPVAVLPNYYPIFPHHRRPTHDDYPYCTNRVADRGHINIGCFGAIRPLKNQLSQAIAAIEFAKRNHKHLRFYINTGRVEMCGGQILKNLRNLFDNTEHELVELKWLPHEKFTDLLRTEIDLGMQVSFSETYNIVAADMTACNVPIVVSNEIYWAHPKCMADPTSVDDILKVMGHVCKNREVYIKLNKELLIVENRGTLALWKRFLADTHEPEPPTPRPPHHTRIWSVIRTSVLNRQRVLLYIKERESKKERR